MRLSQYRGSVVLLDFWAAWCTGCKLTHPAVVELARRHEAQGLVVLGVVYQDTPESAHRYLVRGGELPHPFAVDEQGSLRSRYQLAGIPRMFLIDREGRLIANCIGGQSSEGGLSAVFLGRLRAALASPPAELAVTADMGPAIVSAHVDRLVLPTPRR